MGRLAGRGIVVTGGARGIGEGMVRLFVEEGARCVIADIDVAAGERLAAERPGESYRLIHAALAEALGAQGYAAGLSNIGAAHSPECFVGAVEHDVVADGRKIAGGAQRRTRRALLHQGSVQGAAKLSRAFGPVFAGTLAASVGSWQPPSGLEERIGAMTREKYANPVFLRGRRRSMVFTGAATS